MATHSSMLAWRIPWTEEPGGLQSIELDMIECLTLPLSHQITREDNKRGKGKKKKKIKKKTQKNKKKRKKKKKNKKKKKKPVVFY